MEPVVTASLIGAGANLLGSLFGGNRKTSNSTSMQSTGNKGVYPQFNPMMGNYTLKQDPFKDYLDELIKNKFMG